MVAQKNPTSVQKIKGSSNHVDVLDSKARKSGTFASVSGSDGASEMYNYSFAAIFLGTCFI